jgi:5'(3')-deoxyribonucleotidase
MPKSKKLAPRFVLGVDLDGVVADFYGGLRSIAAEWLDVPLESLPERVTYGLPEWGLNKAPGGYEALHKFAVTQRELFLNLKPIPGAPAALRRLSARDVHIRIITHRLFIKYFHHEAVRQTIKWLDQLDIPYWDLCLVRDKPAVGAHLYIEDTPSNIEKLRAEGNKVIIFTNSTNRHLRGLRADDWVEAEKIIREAQKEWISSKRPTRRRRRRRRGA